MIQYIAAFAMLALVAGCAPRIMPYSMGGDVFYTTPLVGLPVYPALLLGADGAVTEVFPDGTRLSTARRGGRYDGRAVMTFADGRVLRYIYRDGEATGPAILRDASGVREAGRFRGARPDLNAFHMPDYPPLSRRLYESGTVQLSFTVEKDGAITGLTLRDSSGSPRLDNAALEAVRHWRYLPATLDGRTLAMPVSIALPFRLRREG
jgi:TonB family protein